MSRKLIYRVLDNLSPSEAKLANLPRKPDGLYNFVINEYGQLIRRSGTAKYNTDALHTSRITGLHRYYPRTEANKEFLAACNGVVYKLAATSPHAGTSIKTGLTATADVFFENFRDTCYFVNGADGMYKYNGTNCYTVGITPPAAAPTGSGSASGSLSAGNYKVRYTFVDSDGYESNASPESNTITVTASQKIALDIAVSTDPKVTKRRIYRTSVNGALYYFDVEVGNNTATTVDLTQSDIALSAGAMLATDHDVPPATAHLITRRRSRLLLADSDTFYISYIAEPEYFPADWAINTGGRDRITGMSEQQEWLPVFTEDNVERLVGQDEDNFEFQNSYSGTGCRAIRSLVNCNNLLLFWGKGGLFAFDGATARELSRPLSEYLKANVNSAYSNLMAGCFFENRYLLSYPKGESTTNNETVYLDFSNGVTGIFDVAYGCYTNWDKKGDGDRLFAGSATEGRVYEVFTGTDDDGTDITAYDSTEPLDLGMPDTWKQFYDIYVKCKVDAETSLRMYYTLDDGEEQYRDVTLSASTLWYRVRLLGGGQRARAIALRPRVTKDVEIYGYAIVYETEAPEWQS